MALDELHARRLATIVTLVENALERMETALRGMQNDHAPDSANLTPNQVRRIHEEMEAVRKRLEEITERFSVRPQKPELRQAFAAELSSLWVILENALPERMKGYGREFAPEDRTDWERLIRALLRDIEQIRRSVLQQKSTH
jgi:hypothetical protein